MTFGEDSGLLCTPRASGALTYDTNQWATGPKTSAHAQAKSDYIRPDMEEL